MKYYIGIDVSKKTLDISGIKGYPRVSNEMKAIEQVILQLQQRIAQGDTVVVICEASGGYERKLVEICRLAKIPIHIAHANKVRAFAKAQGLLAKTDKLDAQLLCQYGQCFQIEQDSFLLTEEKESIKSLLKRRKHLSDEKIREQNRIETLTKNNIKDSISRHIEWINGEIKRLEKELKVLQNSETIQPSLTLLSSIPGIGKLVASYLISFLPELGKLPHKAIASLVGLAPFNRDSGQFRGVRFIQGGRAKLRHILYMAAVASTRWNPDLKVFYTRLRNSGKPAKLAFIAVARKLVTMANSVMARQAPWQIQRVVVDN